jgi:D-alanyl-D-alanine carboxypeptidase
MMMTMHKTMLKGSMCLLLISCLIFISGEYVNSLRQSERLNALEEKSKELNSQVNTIKEPEIVQLAPKEAVKPKIALSVEDVNFLKIKGLTPPSDRDVRAGLLVEVSTQKILWGKNVTDTYPIASLTKMLTVVTALNEVARRDDIDLKTKVKISSTARNTRSSSFLRKHPESEVTIEELLQSAMIKSANDSCQLLAEFLGGGDEKRFIAMMNSQARQLKMKDSAFYNSHGLPGAYSTPALPDNTSTMADLILVIIDILENHREVLKLDKLSVHGFAYRT